MERGTQMLYRYHLYDNNENQTVYPPLGESPYILEAQLIAATSLLENAALSGHWQSAGSHFSATPAGRTGASSLILGPVDLPENATNTALVLIQAYHFTPATGGNVKARSTSGAAWQLLRPNGDYTLTAPAGHPLSQEPVWQGIRHDGIESRFNLSGFSGDQLWLRLDYGVTGEATLDDYWLVRDAYVEFSTLDASFDVSRELALHPNFPDPFADRTAVQFTLEEAALVQVEVYNIIGQRVSVLASRPHEAGTHTIHFDRQHLTPGLYFLRLSTGFRQLTEPMVIAH